MTCIAVYRVPGEGAALACESRVIAGTDILTDTCRKWLICGPVVAAVAGTDGGLMQALSSAKSWADIVRMADGYSKLRDLSWDLLAYDRRSDRVLQLDHTGLQLILCSVATVGTGGAYALGYLDALPRAQTLDDAARFSAKAVRAAGARNASCGGRVHTLVARGRRKAVEIS